MKKNTFKYKIGERVFVIGTSGVSIISARGFMDFASGGQMNFYCLLGAVSSTLPENMLETVKERKLFLRDCESIKI
jgi:hypothetical protein